MTEQDQPIASTRISTEECQEFGTEEQLSALYGAIAKARGAFKAVPKAKEGQVGHQKFRYAPLSVLQDCTTDALAGNGLAVMQPFSIVGGMACLRTILSHSGGARLVTRFCFEPAKVLADLGKQSTYYRRYAYQALLCVDSGDAVDDPDTDGSSQNIATGAAPQKTQESPPQAGRVVAVKSTAKENPKPPKSPSPESLVRPEGKKDLVDVLIEAQDPGPGLSPDTSAALNKLFVQNKFKGPEVVAMCKQVTGRDPGGLEEPGGEALAVRFLAHVTKLIKERANG